MARAPRYTLPGVALHLIQRGNNRAACFRRDGDYMLYLLHLRELSEALQCSVHAYCLMPNHVHLLLTPATREGCSVLMRNLGQRYVQQFNRAHARTGTLWEGRFRSCLVDSERYLLTCQRYIERNPVRARLAPRPAEYPWSSYRANAGMAPDPLITPHAAYLALGRDGATRREAYRSMLATDVDARLMSEIRSTTNAGRALGGDAFKLEVEKELGCRIEPGRPGRPAGGANETRPEIGL